MILFPNAKINIGLAITEKRSDGFHSIESCFYPVDICDILEIAPSKTLTFQSSGIPIPGKEDDNLCLKAYQLLAADFSISPVAIHLHKIIPIGAGLGGGSADAAFTLKGLNELFSLDLSNDTLEEYARKLGSDCAFFIENKPVFAIERGDVFQPIHLSLSDYEIMVIYPDIHVSTAFAYAGITPGSHQPQLKELLETTGPDEWKSKVFNDFEHNVTSAHSEITECIDLLYQYNAIYASMTGSGSAVYGIFKKAPKLNPKEYFARTVSFR